MKLSEVKIESNAIVDVSEGYEHRLLLGKVVSKYVNDAGISEVIIALDNAVDIMNKSSVVASYASFSCEDLPAIFDIVSVRFQGCYLHVSTSCESLGFYRRSEERFQLSCRGLISFVDSKFSTIPIKTRDVSKSAISFYTFNDPNISVGSEFTIDVLHSLLEESIDDIHMNKTKRIYVIEKITSADYNEILIIAKAKE